VSGGDVAEDSTIARYFDIFAEEFGGQQLRAVVHNAGQYLTKTATNSAGIIDDGTSQVLGCLLQADGSVNLSHMRYYHRIYAEAFIQLVERAVPLLPDGEGAIVGISGMGCNSTQQPIAGYGLPGSGKCVMETTARYYAKTLASRRITVNCVIPGITESDAWKNMAKSSGKGNTEDNTYCQTVAVRNCPMGYAQSARNLGEVVRFLCGPHARYITGVALPCDGGLHLGSPPPSKGKGKGDGDGDKDKDKDKVS